MVVDWKGTLNFTSGIKISNTQVNFDHAFCLFIKMFISDACALEIFIAQLEHFKLDQVTVIYITESLTKFSKTVLMNNSLPWLEKTINSCNCCLNLLKFVIFNLCECSKIDVEQLKLKYCKTKKLSKVGPTKEANKKSKIILKNQIFENWESFENNQKINFWKNLKTVQLIATAYGVRLLSYLAKRDDAILIRMPRIEDAFHLFIMNLSKRLDLQLKECDGIKF